MIREGERAPSFELPGVFGGRPGWVSLDRFLGESVIVLAFYPADFNPSCTDETTDLDEFDVFRMQSDATVLAISGDSVYSHRAFADRYDLSLPLLADVNGEVAEAYGVASTNARHPTNRAVFVIDHDGIITYAWAGEDIEDRPDIETVQAAFRAVDDAELAETQYREGCDHYDEGRDTFVEGMRAYERRDWVLARGEFDTARESLAAATDAFRRAVRFSESEEMAASFERGQQVVDALDRAVGLFVDAASAHASGDLQRGEELRAEGEAAVERVRELGPPPDPDDLPVDVDDDRPTGEGFAELDAVLGASESVDSGGGSGAGDDATDDGLDGAVGDASEGDGDGELGEGDSDIDDEEIDALTEEIETQDAAEEG